MDLVIRGGTVVTAAGSRRADVGVSGGAIAAIGEVAGSGPTLDATGKLVLPGVIDVHTHLRLPAEDDPERLHRDTMAAALGGTTTVLTFIQQPRGGSLLETLDRWRAQAKSESAIDYGFHAIVTDLSEMAASEMPALIDGGCPTFKAFMVYDDLKIDDRDLLRAFQITSSHGGMMMVHCENLSMLEAGVARHLEAGETAPRFHASSRPPAVEAEATHRALSLARFVGAPVYVVHLSCREALAHVRRARRDGQPAYAETCPHYLTLSEERYTASDEEAAKFVISPPLREASQRDDLWRALAEGELDVVGSDHVPRRRADEAKAGLRSFAEIPNGAPGIETLLSLVYQGVVTGRLTIERLVDLLATTPARLFGLERKGAIEVGKDADLVIWDPDPERILSQGSLHHWSDFTPYEGIAVRGQASTVFLGGRPIVRDGDFVGDRGAGKFVPRRLNSGSK
jgi:dihydropyrimidinase